MLEAHHANEPAQVADEGVFVLAIDSNADAFLQSGSAVRMLLQGSAAATFLSKHPMTGPLSRRGSARKWARITPKLEAEHRGQFDQIVDAQLPVLAELRRAGVIRSVFQWPTHEDRLQPAVPRRCQVAGAPASRRDRRKVHRFRTA